MNATDEEAVARVCHEANRAWQIATGDPVVSLPWDETTAEERISAREGVRLAVRGATPEELHQGWVEHKLAGGWVHGETKDAERRTHPCLVPYDQLPPEQRAKDRLFYAIVGALIHV